MPMKEHETFHLESKYGTKTFVRIIQEQISSTLKTSNSKAILQFTCSQTYFSPLPRPKNSEHRRPNANRSSLLLCFLERKVMIGPVLSCQLFSIIGSADVSFSHKIKERVVRCKCNDSSGSSIRPNCKLFGMLRLLL